MSGQRAHLVGSVALDDAETVFRTVGDRLGRDVARIPDGETGDRRTPFPMREGMQEAVRTTPGVMWRRVLEIMGMQINLYGLADGARAEDVTVNPLGFADAAKASYDVFKRMRAEGAVPAGVRMQVCIPSPLMIAMAFVAPEEMTALLPAFERMMRREMEEIAAHVPHANLAIQWDISPEITEVLEARGSELAGSITREQIVAGIAAVTNAVPPDVETGWHLCYGDAGTSTDELETQHLTEPEDLGLLVDLANEIVARITRTLDWVHMPVPRHRDDEAYFAPLARLRLQPGTRLFLGLVHRYDGLDGARRRIAAARTFHADFGVGTECGMGRRRPEDIPELLDLHHEIAAAL